MRSLIGLGIGAALAFAPIADTRELDAQESTVTAAADEPWTREELENLLAPIALYPDPVLAQVLIAATYPDQVQAAAAYINRYGSDRLDEQPWEISVKAVAHYKPVLNLMAEGEDWMIAVGQAYAEQPQDVMDAVQGLRRMANAQGNLVTDDRQRVVVEREVIRIEPAQPQVIYVPTYDPAVVYFRPIYVAAAHPAYWSWGVSYPVGVWLTYDFDWWGHRVYYHGWHTHGPRWVVVARPWVVISPIYVSPRHTTVVVNRRIVQRRFDPAPLRRYTVVHKGSTFDRRGTPGRRVGQVDRRDGPRGLTPDRGNSGTRGNTGTRGNNGNPNPGRRDFDRAADRGLDRRNDRANDGGRRVTPLAGAPERTRANGSDALGQRTTAPTHTGDKRTTERVANGTWNPRAPRTGSSGATTNRSSTASRPTTSTRSTTDRPPADRPSRDGGAVRDAVTSTRQGAPRASAPSRESSRAVRDAIGRTGSSRPSAQPRSSTAAPRASAPKGSSSGGARSSGSSGRSSGAARGSGSGGRSGGAARSSGSSGRGSGSRRPE